MIESEILLIIGGSAHILNGFCPIKNYSNIFFLQRGKKIPGNMIINQPYSLVDYDISNDSIEVSVIVEKIGSPRHVDILFASYSAFGTSETDDLHSISRGLTANCAAPLYFLYNLSKFLYSSDINALFISSIYAHVSPKPSNYELDSQINPLYYGVAKAGVEQGIRWLSSQNPRHIFNSIGLGPMPKPEVIKNSPNLIKSLISSLPSDVLVSHSDLHGFINYVFDSCPRSFRGSTFNLDGGYLIW